MWPNDPESYAGGSVTIGRASYARQVKGDDLNKKGYPDPPGCGLGVWLATLPRQEYLIRNFYQSLGMGIKRLRRLWLRNLDLDAEIEEMEKVCRR